MKLKMMGGFVMIALPLAIVFLVASREPAYEGRHLVSWLEDIDPLHAGFNRSKEAKAEHAVRHIGTRGLPTLIQMMREGNLPVRESWRVRFTKFLAKQKVIKIKVPSSPQPPATEHVQWRALRAVRVLGPKADAAIPEIVPLLTNKSAWVRAGGVRALGSIGPSARRTILLLTNALEDTNVQVRTSATIALADLGPVARDALPALRKHFDDTNTMSLEAMGAYLSITNGSPEVLPYLVRKLNGPHRGWTVSMLRSFGREGREALPELTALLNDPDKNIRRAATNAVKTIQSNEPPYARASSNSFSFANSSFKDVLEFYSRLTGKRVQLSPEIQSFTRVTIQPYGLRNAAEGARWIEEDLSDQANLSFTPAPNGTVFVSYKQNRSN
jgi:hypothetical protein